MCNIYVCRNPNNTYYHFIGCADSVSRMEDDLVSRMANLIQSRGLLSWFSLKDCWVDSVDKDLTRSEQLHCRYVLSFIGHHHHHYHHGYSDDDDDDDNDDDGDDISVLAKKIKLFFFFNLLFNKIFFWFDERSYLVWYKGTIWFAQANFPYHHCCGLPVHCRFCLLDKLGVRFAQISCCLIVESGVVGGVGCVRGGKGVRRSCDMLHMYIQGVPKNVR